MRRYQDRVEVRRGAEDEPEQFLWHGRLWKVRAVLAHWVETGPWWQSASVRSVLGGEEAAEEDRGGTAGLRPVSELLTERELWRVEAGGVGATGVFDLSLDWSDGCWQLEVSHD